MRFPSPVPSISISDTVGLRSTNPCHADDNLSLRACVTGWRAEQEITVTCDGNPIVAGHICHCSNIPINVTCGGAIELSGAILVFKIG